MSNSIAAEYGLDGNGAARNGNGKHDPKFGIVPATHPDTIAVLRNRDALYADDRLNRSQKAWVGWAIDECLNPSRYRDHKKGIACIADSVPGKIFSVTERTIYNWRHNPAVRDYVWFSKVWRPDKWGMMVYHLTALHPAPAEKKAWFDGGGGQYAAGAKARTPEPSAEAAARGREVRNAALAAKRAQKNLPLEGGIAVVTGNFQPGSSAENPVLQAFSAHSQNFFRPTAETDFGSQPKSFSADSRNEFRPTAERDFGGEPKKASAVSRKEVLPPAEKEFRHIEPEQEIESTSQHLKRLGTAARAGKSKAGKRADEEEFLQLVGRVGGGKEVLRNAGLWVNNLRAEPERAWAVWNEVRTMQKESPELIRSTPAKVAMDLWKRWSVEGERKEPARV